MVRCTVSLASDYLRYKIDGERRSVDILNFFFTLGSLSSLIVHGKLQFSRVFRQPLSVYPQGFLLEPPPSLLFERIGIQGVSGYLSWSSSFFSSTFDLVHTASKSFDNTLKYFVSSECDQHRYPWRKYCGSKVSPGVFVSRCNSTCMQIVLNSGILTNRVATGFQATAMATDKGNTK